MNINIDKHVFEYESIIDRIRIFLHLNVFPPFIKIRKTHFLKTVLRRYPLHWEGISNERQHCFKNMLTNILYCLLQEAIH